MQENVLEEFDVRRSVFKKKHNFFKVHVSDLIGHCRLNLLQVLCFLKFFLL